MKQEQIMIAVTLTFEFLLPIIAKIVLGYWRTPLFSKFGNTWNFHVFSIRYMAAETNKSIYNILYNYDATLTFKTYLVTGFAETRVSCIYVSLYKHVLSFVESY